MNFFLYQPELPYTINLIPGQNFGHIPVVLVFSALFLIILVLGLILKKRFNFKIKNIFIISALVGWLALLLQFIYGLVIDFKNISNFIDAPEDQKIEWRHCNLDKNFHFNNLFCNLHPFTKEITKIIPVGSNINVVSASISIYLNYYLVDSYKITDLPRADYLIFYWSKDKFFYEGNKLYAINNGAKNYLGDFTLLYSTGPAVAIFKKQ